MRCGLSLLKTYIPTQQTRSPIPEGRCVYHRFSDCSVRRTVPSCYRCMLLAAASCRCSRTPLAVVVQDWLLHHPAGSRSCSRCHPVCLPICFDRKDVKPRQVHFLSHLRMFCCIQG